MVRAALWSLPLVLGSAGACSQPAGPGAHSARVRQASQPVAVTGLPFAQGRAFATLDDYLAFRKNRGAHDVPWYREIRPGTYELVTRRGPGATPEIHTREDLERKFGFRR